MEVVKKRRASAILSGFFLLSHPGPVFIHIIGVTVFTLIAAWPRPLWGTILLVIAAHAAMQISIAMINDYCDRGLDAASKPRKPIPLGLVYPHEALIVGLLMIAVMVLLLLPLNPLALYISLLYLTLGQAYNLGLKSTPLSGIVFALAMPLIPLYAFAGVGRVFPILLWLVPIGFFLGVALNLANSLEDLEEDSAYGAKTLAVVLGLKGSFLVCHLLILAAAASIAMLLFLHIVPANFWIIIPTLVVTCVALAVMMFFFGAEKPVSTRKAHFYLAALTAIVLAGGWLIGVIV
jgi:4-hydroxybenzoate polyprenyltransferase